MAAVAQFERSEAYRRLFLCIDIEGEDQTSSSAQHRRNMTPSRHFQGSFNTFQIYTL